MSLAQANGLPLPSRWRPLRLETLVLIRWLAIAGQTIGLIFVAFGLGFTVPLLECFALIAASVAVNIWLVVRFDARLRPSSHFTAGQIAFDLLQLGGLLALTGGLQNPFSLLLLAPVSVSATTLPQRATWGIAVLATLVASVISLVHLPLPWAPGEELAFNRIYVIGIWVAIVCGVVFLAAYTTRVAHDARQMADALAATELALSRKEQLSALDGLAAAAAHELGTPLSTIALAAKEMRADVPPGSDLADDVELIIGQAQRCRAILAKLRNLGNETGDIFAAVPLTDLLAEVARPHEGRRKAILFYYEDGTGEPPVFVRSVGLLYGLGNIIENAADFARETVRIEAGWNEKQVFVSITDDGPGFPPELIARLGEPYLTTRPRDPQGPDANQPGGLGLGVFIAKTLLERTGGRLAFRNISADGHHAQVRIVWPREAIEAMELTKTPARL
jgi:two-component system sensor histidine kinase RegB